MGNNIIEAERKGMWLQAFFKEFKDCWRVLYEIFAESRAGLGEPERPPKIELPVDRGQTRKYARPEMSGAVNEIGAAPSRCADYNGAAVIEGGPKGHLHPSRRGLHVKTVDVESGAVVEVYRMPDGVFEHYINDRLMRAYLPGGEEVGAVYYQAAQAAGIVLGGKLAMDEFSDHGRIAKPVGGVGTIEGGPETREP